MTATQDSTIVEKLAKQPTHTTHEEQSTKKHRTQDIEVLYGFPKGAVGCICVQFSTTV